MVTSSSRPSHRLGRVVRAAAFGYLLAAGTMVDAHAAGQGPFAGMSGAWSGDGTVVMADGSRERMRCRATYSVEPEAAALNQGLRCASDSYTFDVKSYVQVTEGGMLSGNWSEAVRGVSGDVTGRVLAAGKIDTSVETFGFSAALSVSTQCKRQHVSIVPQGTDVLSVTIDLQRI